MLSITSRTKKFDAKFGDDPSMFLQYCAVINLRKDDMARKRNDKRKPARTERKVQEEIPLLIDLESGIHKVGHQTWEFFHRVPLQGALTSGAVGLYAITVFGVAELLTAGLCAYLSYPHVCLWRTVACSA